MRSNHRKEVQSQESHTSSVQQSFEPLGRCMQRAACANAGSAYWCARLLVPATSRWHGMQLRWRPDDIQLHLRCTADC